MMASRASIPPQGVQKRQGSKEAAQREEEEGGGAGRAVGAQGGGVRESGGVLHENEGWGEEDRLFQGMPFGSDLPSQPVAWAAKARERV